MSALIRGQWPDSRVTLTPFAGGAARTLQSLRQERVSLADFGVVGDDKVSDRAAVQAAMTYCYNNNKALFVPKPRVAYLLDGQVSVPGAITMIGEAQSPSVTPAYQQGNPVVVFHSTVVGDYPMVIGSSNYLRGLHLANFRIYGAGVDGYGLHLENTGWDGYISNLVIEGFQRNGVTLDYVQDALIAGLGIIDCGKENVYPSLNMVNGCNSVHFVRPHIEVTPYMMNINNGGDITFEGGHFEVSEYPSGAITVMNRYSRYSQIIINGGSNNIKFNDTLFAPNSVQAVAAQFGVNANTVAPMVNVQGVGVRFKGCSWRQTQSGKSSNMLSMANSSSCTIEGCEFDQVYTDVNGIVLSGTQFIDNDVTWLDTGGTLFYGIANSSTGSPSFADRNRLFCQNSAGSAKTAGYLFSTGAAAAPLKLGDNEINVSKFYKHHNAACQAQAWRPATRVMVDGLTSIDLESYDTNTLFGFNNTATTIGSIANPAVGQQVRFLSYSAAASVINNGGIVVLKGGANASIPNNGVLTLQENMSGLLVEASRSF